MWLVIPLTRLIAYMCVVRAAEDAALLPAASFIFPRHAFRPSGVLTVPSNVRLTTLSLREKEQ